MEAPELHRRVTGRTSPERSRDELRAPRDVLAAARKRPLIRVCVERNHPRRFRDGNFHHVLMRTDKTTDSGQRDKTTDNERPKIPFV